MNRLALLLFLIAAPLARADGDRPVSADVEPEKVTLRGEMLLSVGSPYVYAFHHLDDDIGLYDMLDGGAGYESIYRARECPHFVWVVGEKLDRRVLSVRRIYFCREELKP